MAGVSNQVSGDSEDWLVEAMLRAHKLLEPRSDEEAEQLADRCAPKADEPYHSPLCERLQFHFAYVIGLEQRVARLEAGE